MLAPAAGWVVKVKLGGRAGVMLVSEKVAVVVPGADAVTL